MTIERVYYDDESTGASEDAGSVGRLVNESGQVLPVEPSIDLTRAGEGPILTLVGSRSASTPTDARRPAADCRYRSGRLAAKWVFDRSVSIVTFVATLPLLVIVGLVVKATSPGPVFFRQRRIGRCGRHFTIYKFRTMRADAEEFLAADPQLASLHRANDFKLSIDDDVRVTRVGRFLRRSSLDELPQLVNIIKGDMSFVGPRPVVPDEIEQYGPCRAMYEAAYPGLTGAWQVAGRECTKYPARAELDADYVDGWTFWGDLVIMLKTIPALLDPRRTN